MIVLLFLLLFVAHASAFSCNLRCWLQNLTVSLPAQSFSNALGSASISDLQCSDVHLETLNSSFVPPLALSINVLGVRLGCSGQFNISALGGLTTEAGGVAVRVNESSVAGELRLNQTGDVPVGVRLHACSTAFRAFVSFQCSGVLCAIADALAPQIDSYVASQLDANVCKALADLTAVNGTAALQQFDATFIAPLLAPPPPPALPIVRNDSLSMLNNSAVELLDYVLDDVVGATGNLSVNRIVDFLTNGTGAFSVNGTTLAALVLGANATGNETSLDFVLPINGTGVVTIGVDLLSIAGLNTWSQLDLLRPVSDYLLRSRTATDALNLTVDFHVHAAADPNGPVHDGSLSESGTLHAQLSNCNMLADVILSLSAAKLARVDVSQLGSADCVLQSVLAAEITDLQLHTDVRGVALVADSGDLEADVDLFVNNLFLLVFSSFDTVLSRLINGVVAEPLRNAVNAAVLAQVAAAAASNGTCDAVALSDGPTPLVEQWGTVAALSIAAGLWLAVILGICIQGAINRRQANSDERRALLRNAAAAADKHAVSLSQHPRLHWLWRYTVPLMIVATASVFFSSNTATGASVVAVVSLGAARIEPPALFAFSLVNSVRDMWNAEVYGLSLLVAVLSGAWVYLKLLLMLVTWFLPPTWLSLVRRDAFLYVLDLTGKWSLIDAFVLVQMGVGFRFHLAVPDAFAHSAAPAAIDVYVRSDFGFFSFVGATFVSLTLTHIIVALNRRATDPDAFSNREPLDGARPSALRNRLSRDMPPINDVEAAELRGATTWQSASARRRLTGRRDITQCTLLGRVAVALLLLGTAVLTIYGSYVDSFHFVFGGAAGVAMRYLSGTDTLRLSLIKLGTMITDVAMPSPDQLVGATVLKVVFLGVAFALPLAHLLIVLILWLIPLPLGFARRLLFVAEVVSAWAALDVFAVSLLVALFEIRQFAQFIIGDKCDLINQLLRDYASAVFPAGETPKCFDVHTVLLDGVWVLVAAFVAYFLISWYVTHLCHAALEPHVEVQPVPKVRDADDDNDDDERPAGRVALPAKEVTKKSWEARFLVALALAEEIVVSSRE
jgi:hypothetical protein